MKCKRQTIDSVEITNKAFKVSVPSHCISVYIERRYLRSFGHHYMCFLLYIGDFLQEAKTEVLGVDNSVNKIRPNVLQKHSHYPLKSHGV